MLFLPKILVYRGSLRNFGLGVCRIAMAGRKESPVVSSEQVVTPWEVTGERRSDGSVAINYDKLLEQFGCSRIDDALIKRFEKVTGRKAHHLLRRGLFFAHRDLDRMLNLYERGVKFYIYTGRGPSSGSLHIGHIVPLMFCQHLQEIFDAFLIVQFTDDEKYLFRPGLEFEDIEKWTIYNAKDVISLGFNPKKTFFFVDTKSMWDSIGKAHFVALESAPAFSSTFPNLFPVKVPVPCIIPAAIDQDPFFRIARDFASRSHNIKPALIYSSFMPALEGVGEKMSASSDATSIFLTDTPERVKTKINKYGFSGGRSTVEEHRRLGGNVDLDVPFQYLRYILEDDDELERLKVGYERGELLSSDMKNRCIGEVNKLLKRIQEVRPTSKLITKLLQKRKARITDEILEEFMTPFNAAGEFDMVGEDIVKYIKTQLS